SWWSLPTPRWFTYPRTIQRTSTGRRPTPTIPIRQCITRRMPRARRLSRSGSGWRGVRRCGADRAATPGRAGAATSTSTTTTISTATPTSTGTPTSITAAETGTAGRTILPIGAARLTATGRPRTVSEETTAVLVTERVRETVVGPVADWVTGLRVPEP